MSLVTVKYGSQWDEKLSFIGKIYDVKNLHLSFSVKDAEYYEEEKQFNQII